MKYYITATAITIATAILLIPLGEAAHGTALGGEWIGIAGVLMFAMMWARWRVQRRRRREAETPIRDSAPKWHDLTVAPQRIEINPELPKRKYRGVKLRWEELTDVLKLAATRRPAKRYTTFYF